MKKDQINEFSTVDHRNHADAQSMLRTRQNRKKERWLVFFFHLNTLSCCYSFCRPNSDEKKII